jgi:hypothetical protein
MVLVMIFIMSRHKRRKEQQSCQRQNGAESFLQTRLHTQLLSVRFLLSIPTLERQKGRTCQSLIDQRGTSWIERLESRRGILCMHRFRWSRYTTPWTILLGCALAAASLSAAEDRGFVHPDQATTYIDPVTRSEITVLIDQYLGGTSDLTIARLTLPPRGRYSGPRPPIDRDLLHPCRGARTDKRRNGEKPHPRDGMCGPSEHDNPP